MTYIFLLFVSVFICFKYMTYSLCTVHSMKYWIYEPIWRHLHRHGGTNANSVPPVYSSIGSALGKISVDSTNRVIIGMRWTSIGVNSNADKLIKNTYYFTAYLRHSSRLFCWIETKSIFSARSSRESTVFSISPFTWSWWLPSSFCISEY